MPKEKDFKRLVRRRMEKTGESYTTARSHLLSSRSDDSTPVRPDPLPADYQALAGMSDDAVRNATGKDWGQWTAFFDGHDAATLPHAEIALLAAAEDGTSDWWAQMVTVAYERFRGLRDVGQRRGGGYDVNKSKTVGVPVAVLFNAFQDEGVRSRWLGDMDLTIRKATPHRSMRIRLADDTPLDVYFTAKSDERSSVQVQHRRLPDKDAAERMKAFWGERLTALTDVIGP